MSEKLYLLSLSMHNEDYIFIYARNESELKAIAKNYVLEMFLMYENEIKEIVVDWAKNEVEIIYTHDLGYGYTFYITTLKPFTDKEA